MPTITTWCLPSGLCSSSCMRTCPCASAFTHGVILPVPCPSILLATSAATFLATAAATLAATTAANAAAPESRSVCEVCCRAPAMSSARSTSSDTPASVSTCSAACIAVRVVTEVATAVATSSSTSFSSGALLASGTAGMRYNRMASSGSTTPASTFLSARLFRSLTPCWRSCSSLAGLSAVSSAAFCTSLLQPLTVHAASTWSCSMMQYSSSLGVVPSGAR
mmetsp:Transcript_15322/g.33172  ORF Transcript_15322/g.33172 Transcript_15322/m.33172 type:complete len:222 (-) Transcript_15322:1053-1718(-)